MMLSFIFPIVFHINWRIEKVLKIGEKTAGLRLELPKYPKTMEWINVVLHKFIQLYTFLHTLQRRAELYHLKECREMIGSNRPQCDAAATRHLTFYISMTYVPTILITMHPYFNVFYVSTVCVLYTLQVY
jgi:hypothetical protein